VAGCQVARADVTDLDCWRVRLELPGEEFRITDTCHAVTELPGSTPDQVRPQAEAPAAASLVDKVQGVVQQAGVAWQQVQAYCCWRCGACALEHGRSPQQRSR
jgi:hypothetical protein